MRLGKDAYQRFKQRKKVILRQDSMERGTDNLLPEEQTAFTAARLKALRRTFKRPNKNMFYVEEMPSKPKGW